MQMQSNTDRTKGSRDTAMKIYWVLSVVLWTVYLFLAFTASQEQARTRYGLSSAQFFALILSIILPIAVIWMAGAWGGHRLRKYSRLIEGSKESRPIATISRGVLILILGLIVNSVLSSIRTRFREAPLSYENLTILVNYTNIMFQVTAMWSFFSGARALATTLNPRPLSRARMVTCAVVALILSSLLAFVVLTNPYRRYSSEPNIRPVYMLPDVAIALTIVLPQAIGWTLGIFAALYAYTYAMAVSGLIFKRAFRLMAFGFVALIGLYVFSQLLSLLTLYFSQAALGPILVVIYVLLAFMALAYGLIALGAKKLTRIETI